MVDQQRKKLRRVRAGGVNGSGPKSRFRLRERILLGYAVPAILLVGIALATYQAAAVAEASADEDWHRQENIVDSSQLEAAFLQASVNYLAYLRTGNPTYLEGYEAAVAEFRQAEADLSDLLDPEAQAAFSTIVAEAEAWFEVSEARLADGPDDAAPAGVEGTPTEAAREVSTAIDELQAVQFEGLRESREQTLDALRGLLAVVIAGLALGVLGAIGIGLLTSRHATRTISSSAHAITSTSTEIAAAVAQHERVAARQATAVSETTTTMNELNSSARQMDDQAQVATEASREALDLADEGQRAVRQTIDGVTALRARVAEASEQILHLDEQTGQIGSVVDLVGDIANQTNMLAINAAIEASRAGEHGRGFAVVSTEIRKLSDESKRSADRIHGILRDIKQATASTVMANEEGMRTLRDVVERTGSTAETFNRVAGSAKRSHERTQQISLSARQQAVAVEQVVQAMESLNAGASETAAGIRQTKVGLDQVEDATGRLQSMI